MEKKVLIILDPGHGGIIEGKYVTPGKRSPFFEDHTQFYEGVNNRNNVKLIMEALKAAGIECIDIVDTQEDISLPERCRRANKLLTTHPNCLYVSIHSDAAGDGKEWNPASGISVYTSKGQTKSDIAASLWIDALEEQFENTVLWRKDTSDKDEDKEENFYVLANTTMPAMLGELGFHTNKAQCTRMQTKEWKDKVVRSLVKACLQYQKMLNA